MQGLYKIKHNLKIKLLSMHRTIFCYKYINANKTNNITAQIA